MLAVKTYDSKLLSLFVKNLYRLGSLNEPRPGRVHVNPSDSKRFAVMNTRISRQVVPRVGTGGWIL